MTSPSDPRNAAQPSDALKETRVQARLAWNGWPDTADSRREIAAHEARDAYSALAWDRVIEAVRALPASPGEPVAWHSESLRSLLEEFAPLDTYSRISECLAALMKHPALAAPQCPDGWKMVPVEHTHEMEMAFVREMVGDFATSYAAMLAAAPSFENIASPKSGDGK